MSLKTGPLDTKFPWYKERLQSKYLRDLGERQQLCGALDGHRWRFLSPGLDDFRDGYPTVHRELYTQRKRGTSPAVFSMPMRPCSVRFPQKSLNKDQACYSKQNPQSQTQRQFIDAVEHRLTQHPLVLYPHLESVMTPEVLSVLHPKMCVKSEVGKISPTDEMRESVTSPPASPPDTENTLIIRQPQREKCKDARATNLYKRSKCKEIRLRDQMNSLDLHEDDELMITKHFCEWIHSLGGETNDLTESTILDLFKSDYEKKSLMPPIQKTDSNKTPAKLHSAVDDHHTDPPPVTVTLSKACNPNRLQTAKNWRKSSTNEPLRTPSDITDSLDVEGQLSEQDMELKQSHGIQAFRQFILDKGVRMPRFLRVLFSEEELKNRSRT